MRVMASTLFHPLINFSGLTPTPSNSSSTTTSSSVNLPHPISMPNGLPSGLSVTITSAPSNTSYTPSTTSSMMSNSSQSLGGVTITKSNGQIINNFEHSNSNSNSSSSSSSSSSCPSPPPSLINNNNNINNNNQSNRNNQEIVLQQQQQQQQQLQQQQQQQQLRALASSLQSMTTHLNVNTINNTTPATSPLVNQAALIAAASKLKELNPIDDIVMQEVTQRLWQQAGVSAAAMFNNNNNNNNNGQGSSGGGITNTIVPLIQQQQQQRDVVSGVHQINDLKMNEKLVNELAVQQSTRNAFHLNERTLQECWNTLQRVSCMIFMHKSAMQLQQQASGHGVHHVGNPNRPGSMSPGASENGAPKPHQCHQCLKSFSSNHQLVQHIRVHTGEKPYKCSYCERRFKQLSHVQQHTRLHTGERPYKCHVHECGRAFIQLSNLQQHLRNHDAQLERSKNRPFHCNICGKGFATESSLRTHTTKVCKDQHAALIGGPNAVTCPICHKLFLGGESLMEHMKHTHKDPNASGVATKRRTANHPCPICGKHYVNEGSLRKHLTCHPETAQLTSSLRMWPCSVCQAVFTHENGLLTHMDQMRTDPKHQFAAQYVLSRAAAESRERENIMAAATVAAMTGAHPFGTSSQGQLMPSGSHLPSLMPMTPPSPSGSESSGRLSSPLDTNSGLSSVSVLQHTRMSSPVIRPLDARVNTGNNSNNIVVTSTTPNQSNYSQQQQHSGNSTSVINSSSQPTTTHERKEHGNQSKYEGYEKLSSSSRTSSQHNNHNHQIENNVSVISRDHHHSIVNHPTSNLHPHLIENGQFTNKFQAAEQAAMKMAAILGQGHGQGHSVFSQNDLRTFIQHQANSQLHNQDMMSKLKADSLLRSQATEALRLAVSNVDRANGGGSSGNGQNNNNNNNNNNNSGDTTSSNGNGIESIGNHLILTNSAQQQHELYRGNLIQNGHGNSMHHPSLNHPLNTILTQQDFSEALLRQLDSRNLGFPLTTHN